MHTETHRNYIVENKTQGILKAVQKNLITYKETLNIYTELPQNQIARGNKKNKKESWKHHNSVYKLYYNVIIIKKYGIGIHIDTYKNEIK